MMRLPSAYARLVRKPTLFTICGLSAVALGTCAAATAEAVPAPLTAVEVKRHIAFVAFANENISVIVLRRGLGQIGHVVQRINLKPSLKPIRTVKLGQLAEGEYTVTLNGPVYRAAVHFDISASHTLR